MSEKEIIHAASTGTILTRMIDGVFIHVNKAYADIHGYSVEEMIGKSVFELNTWASVDQRKDLIDNLLQNGSVSNAEITALARDGSCRKCLLSAELILIDGEKYCLGLIQAL